MTVIGQVEPQFGCVASIYYIRISTARSDDTLNAPVFAPAAAPKVRVVIGT